MFKDLWDAMTAKQREGISWMAVQGDRTIGDTSEDDMMAMAIAATDMLAKSRSNDYEGYRDQVIALCQGMAKGMLDGGIDYYLKKNS